MAEINGLGNLSRNGVRPLRNVAKARETQNQAAQRFSVDALKSGGEIDLSGLKNNGGHSPNEAQPTVRQRYRGQGPAKKAAESHQSPLPLNEQIEQLSKIRKSAVEYESVLLDQFVKQMRQSPMAETPGGETFSDIAEQPFRDFLSQAGGLGLADHIVGQIARQEGLERTLNDYPEIMGPGWNPTIPPNLMKKPAGNLETAPENIRETKPADHDVNESEATGAENAEVGLMDAEEIAYLYQDASEGLA